MTEKIDQFFKAYWSDGMKSFYSQKVPREIMKSGIDKDGWYEWKLIPGTLTIDDYKVVEERFNIKFPNIFIEWHKRFFFADCDCSLLRLPHSLPTIPLEEIIINLNWEIPKKIIPMGLIPFAEEGNDSGPLVFDTRNSKTKNDFPIRVYDHEYGGVLEGLSNIIFSSFEKLLECLTHYLVKIKTKKRFEVIPDFYSIDPDGAGSAGKQYLDKWIMAGKADFEEYGN